MLESFGGFLLCLATCKNLKFERFTTLNFDFAMVPVFASFSLSSYKDVL
jgi:hypothetical protein